MGYLLPARMYFKSMDTNESFNLGSVSLSAATEIYSIRFFMYKTGTAAGTERFRVKLYRDSGRTDLAYTSSYTSLSDVTDLGAIWVGWVSVLFDRENVPASTTFYPTLEMSNYTRSGDTFYVAFGLDWPNPQYGTDNTTRRNLAMQIYGYEDVT